MSYCLVVPHFNHVDAFEKFLPTLVSLNLPCIVVDDGSTDEVKQRLESLLAQYPQIHFYAHAINRGKGAAMWTGAHMARSLGYTHMLQIDADGQHDAADVQAFIKDSKENPSAIISGAPQFDDSAPKARVYGRKVTDFWVALETMRLDIKDIDIRFIETNVIYFENSVSHFHYLQDNLRLIWLHTRLMCGMLVRLPIKLWAKIHSIIGHKANS